VRIRSRPGETIFAVRWSAGAAEASMAGEAPPDGGCQDAPEGAAERLLVVDDDLAMRRLLEVTLPHLGHAVAARA
jgi:hypothetical protein